jgi:hypothetical protein
MSDIPAKLIEMDRLRLQLSKERQARLRAEAQNLQMSLARHEAEVRQAAAEDKASFDTMKALYQLEANDEILGDGTIKRAPVRALKEA